MLTEYFAYSDGDKDLWYRFEQNLANLDVDEILSIAPNFMPNYGSEDFRDRDRYDFQHEMERYLEKLTTGLLEEFRSFIESAKIPPDAYKKKIKLDPSATFLNFNYTNTLQELYQIEDSQINYIHNAASDQDHQIILGHGIDPEQLKRSEPVPPPGLSGPELSEWMDEQSDQYDHSYELGKDMIRGYFSASFKNTIEIIENNAQFFASLTNIEQVIVLGHSVSEVDTKYFAAVAASAPGCSWSASYFTDEDRVRIIGALQDLGIDPIKISFFKIVDLVPEQHTG